jgi:acyl-CoA thioesterase-1
VKVRTCLILTLAAACGTGAGCSEPAAASAGPSRLPATLKIVALGDSLTSGRGISRSQAYPALLERSLHDAGLPFSVTNHGVSGDTTAGGVRRVAAALDEGPQILIVALGANDGLRGVPVSQVRANLERIIEAAQARGVVVLLCGMEALPIYGWQYSVDFHRVFRDLAEQYKLTLVPFLLQGVFGNQELLQPDYVHPNAAGAKVIASNIWPYLQPLAATLVAAP